MSEDFTDQRQIPPGIREDILQRDEYECQLCGSEGLCADGTIPLQVHHKIPPQESPNPHRPSNLITLCKSCHSWTHKQPNADEVPVQIGDDDREVLLPHDISILLLLSEHGPLSTGEIQEKLTLEISTVAIRERLWLMMGLDYEVQTREKPLIDQDAVTGNWGLPTQIDESERGKVPDDIQALLRRAEDEHVRRALARGCERETVANVLDIAERTTWHKQRRAQAYDFPLAAFERGSRNSKNKKESTIEEHDLQEPQDNQQRLEDIEEMHGEEAVEQESKKKEEAEQENIKDGEAELLRDSIKDVIQALQKIEYQL